MFTRLETSFGGGNTHSLIALYHSAQRLAEGLAPGIVPKDPIPARSMADALLVHARRR
jgi:hypothetical protein